MAKNKIAGLTIEIGGDTGPLSKALADVNRKSRDLSTELKQVDRMLKLDPKNTELVAQKQKLLSESIGTTSEKLDKLKIAEKQAQDQFKKGKISEEQYRAIQREVIKTEGELQKLKDSTKDFEKTISKSLENAGKKVQDFGGKVEKSGKSFAPVSAAAAGILTGLYANTQATKEYREEMAKLETAFTTSGHTAEDAKQVYDDFYAVLGEEDRSVEAVSHLAKLTTTQEELTDWTTIATGVYATFGDSLPIEGLTEAANETAKTGKLTGVLTDALNWAGVSEEDFQAKLEATNSEKERSELITETLNGLYTESAEKYREVNAEVIEANEIQGEMTDTMADLAKVTQPLINDILKGLVDVVSNIVEWFSGLDEETVKLIVGILALVAGLAPLLIIIGKVITAVGVITSALPGLGVVFAALTGPIGIAIAAVAAVIAIGVALYKNWDTIKDKASQFAESISQIFTNIKNAISDKINAAKDAVKAAIDMIKGFFKFEWSLPKIKLPHFKLDGKFSLYPPSVPKLAVDWYKDGGIFDRPSIIGVGEAGKEAVIPLNQLSGILADAMSKSGGNENNNEYNIIINNPKLEKSGDSVRKTLLKHSYGVF